MSRLQIDAMHLALSIMMEILDLSCVAKKRFSILMYCKMLQKKNIGATKCIFQYRIANNFLGYRILVTIIIFKKFNFMHLFSIQLILVKSIWNLFQKTPRT